jgi:hypothetical protein
MKMGKMKMRKKIMFALCYWYFDTDTVMRWLYRITEAKIKKSTSGYPQNIPSMENNKSIV